MADNDQDLHFSPQLPSHVSLSPFTPIPSPLHPRRLSTHFAKPSSPVRTSRKKPPLAWVSLQGILVGAHEATSARAISGSFTPEEAVAWELFSPIHRVLIVAVVAAAAVKSEKNRQIHRLSDAVHLRDQILMSMQEKLDGLCEQATYIKDEAQPVSDLSASKNVDSISSEASLPFKSDSICTGCWLCDQHRAQMNDLSSESIMKIGSSDEMFKGRISITNVAEQEERRMSDLSDWASSVTSTADIQLNNLSIEQDICNLKKECEEKDAALKELSTFICSKDVATSKRIEELEDIIRRKNTIISKLKKDLVVLEQKVMNLTRLRRRSFSGTSKDATKQLPMMTENLLYDMDSSTSPSSSDSDCSSRKQNARVAIKADTPQAPPLQSGLTCENASNQNQKPPPAKISPSLAKISAQTPLKEKSLNQRHYVPTSPRLIHTPISVGTKNNPRQAQTGLKDPAPQKRWV